MAPHPKTNYLKIISLIFLAIIFFIFLIFMAAPAILSTTWGQQRLLKQMNERIPGRVTAQNIHLSWLGKQSIQGFVLHDETGAPVLTIDSFILEKPLMKLVRPNDVSLNAYIEGLNAKITQDSSGSTNLQQALGITSPLSEKQDLPYSIELKNVQGHVQLVSKNEPIAVRLIGTTQNGSEEGSFDVDMLLNGLTVEQVERLSAKIVNLPVDLIDQFIALQNPSWMGKARSTFGKEISLELEQDKGPEGAKLDLHITSPNLSAFFKGSLKSNEFTLNEPGKIDFLLTPLFWQQWIGESGITLQQATHLHLTLSDLKLPLSDLSALAVQAKIHLPQANIVGVPGFKQMALKQVHIDLNKQREDPLINLKIQGESDQSGSPAIFAFNGAIDHQSQKYDAVLTADPLHVKEIPGVGDIALQDTKLHISGDTLAEKKIQFTANLAPLSKNSPLTSSSPVKITLHGAAGLEAVGTIEIDYLAFGNPNSPSFASFKDLMIPWHLDALNNQINLSLEGRSKIGTGHGENSFSGQINIIHWIKNGRINLATTSINGTVNSNGELPFHISGNWDRQNQLLALRSNVKQLPAALFCQVLGLEKSKRMKLEGTLGPIVDADIDIQLQQMNGLVKASLSGAHGLFHLDGAINQGYLTLNSPFYAEVEATPLLSESILQDLIPLLAGMTRADDRLRIGIDPEGFQMPIFNISLNNIHVGHMSIELGNAYFDGYGQVANILSLLKVIPSEEISVWFTPIYLTIQDGYVHIERFDMLAMERYPIAAWGSIDFPQDYIGMKIGLSGRSLQQATRIPIPDRNFMMQFPLKGRIGHARIDKSKVAAKIAALTASIAGGPHGLVLGAVIGIASGAFSEDSIPPPTTNPLPWDTEAGEEGTINTTLPNPIRAVQKGASNLLKNLLR